MKRAYFFLFYLIYSNHVFSDDFGPVFNTGLSKMEMIEKMDQYLSGELRSELQDLKMQNVQIKEKNQEDFKHDAMETLAEHDIRDRQQKRQLYADGLKTHLNAKLQEKKGNE